MLLTCLSQGLGSISIYSMCNCVTFLYCSVRYFVFPFDAKDLSQVSYVEISKRFFWVGSVYVVHYSIPLSTKVKSWYTSISVFLSIDCFPRRFCWAEPKIQQLGDTPVEWHVLEDRKAEIREVITSFQDLYGNTLSFKRTFLQKKLCLLYAKGQTKFVAGIWKPQVIPQCLRSRPHHLRIRVILYRWF